MNKQIKNAIEEDMVTSYITFGNLDELEQLKNCKYTAPYTSFVTYLLDTYDVTIKELAVIYHGIYWKSVLN